MEKKEPTLMQVGEALNEMGATLKQVLNYSLLSAKNVLTLNDTALLTGLSKSYLYKLTCTNQIPFYKPNGKQIYFERGEIETWQRQNRQSTKAEAEQKALAYVVAKDRKRGVR